MVSLRRASAALWALVYLLAAPVAAAGQTAEFSGTMTRLAEDLARAVARPGGRVAVLPIDDVTGVYGAQVPVALTGQLQTGLAAQHEPSRTIEIVAATEVTRAINELRLPRPIDPAGAALIGALVNADYVSVGELTPLGAGRARIALRLVEVGTRRAVRSGVADVALAGTAPASPAVAAQTPTFGPPSRPFWDGRRAAIASGFAASAAAAYMAMSAERDLRDTRNRLLQVPPGATDEWNALLDEATGQERTRNFWWGAVAGVSGVTLAYMLASESPDRAPRPFPAGALTLPGRWRLHVNPALPFLMLRRSF